MSAVDSIIIFIETEDDNDVKDVITYVKSLDIDERYDQLSQLDTSWKVPTIDYAYDADDEKEEMLHIKGM
jgi:hypothetical protein